MRVYRLRGSGHNRFAVIDDDSDVADLILPGMLCHGDLVCSCGGEYISIGAFHEDDLDPSPTGCRHIAGVLAYLVEQRDNRLESWID